MNFSRLSIGISISLEGQKNAFFSTGKMINGKTSIARYEDVAKCADVFVTEQRRPVSTNAPPTEG